MRKPVALLLSVLPLASCAARSRSAASISSRLEPVPLVEFECDVPDAQGILVRLADRTGESLPGADVEVRSSGVGQLLAAGKTDASGEVRFQLPHRADLVVSASFIGFEPVAITPVTVRQECRTTIAVQLEVRSACGPIEVVAKEPSAPSQ